MPTDATLDDLLARAAAWLADDPDPATRARAAGGDRGGPGRPETSRPSTTSPTASPARSSSGPPGCAASWAPARTG